MAEGTSRPGLVLRGLRHAVRVLRDAWLLIGAALLLALVIELTTCSVVALRPRNGATDPRSLADGYQGAEWTAPYFRELGEAQATRWRPYVYWRRAPFRGQYINVDEDGHRVTPVPAIDLAADATTLKVFLFGGSTLWGTGARDSYTIPSLLAEGLARNGVRPDVTNFGETGYVSTQSVIELMLQLRAGNVPDMVIFLDGINDVFAAYQSGEAGIPQNEANRVREFNVLNPSRRPEMAPLLWGAVQRTTIFDLLSGVKLPAMADVDRPHAPDRDGAIGPGERLETGVVRTYSGNLKTVRALADAYGFDAYFFWQPVIFDKLQLSAYERAQKNEWRALQPFFASAYQAIRENRGVLDAYGFSDLSQIFRDTVDPVFIDYGHVTEDGNRVLAEKALEAIRLPDRRLQSQR